MIIDQLEAIADAARSRHAQSIANLATLISAGGEGRAAVEREVEAAMDAAGCRCESFVYDPATVPMIGEFAVDDVAVKDSARCLVGRLEGAGRGRSVILFAHPDTETLRSEPPWQHDPFEPRESGGRLHGWGVADDLAGMAMMFESLTLLKSAGLAPAGDVTLVSAPSKAHRRGIAAALHKGLMADAAVYCHPAESGCGLDEINAFAPGQLEFTITVGGRMPDTDEPAHTAFAHTAENPFEKMMPIVAALKALDAARGNRVRHPRLESAIGRSTNLMVSRCDFGRQEPLSRLSPSLTLGCAMTTIPGEKLDAVIAEVEAAVAEASITDPWLAGNPCEISWVSGVSAAETPDDHPLYRATAAALKRVGASPVVNPLHTSSDIRNPIVQRGIPTVGFGPRCGNLTMSGHADEWVDCADYLRAVRALSELIANWCGLRNLGYGPQIRNHIVDAMKATVASNVVLSFSKQRGEVPVILQAIEGAPDPVSLLIQVGVLVGALPIGAAARKTDVTP